MFLFYLLLIVKVEHLSSTIICSNTSNTETELLINNEHSISLSIFCRSTIRILRIRNSSFDFSQKFHSNFVPLATSLRSLRIERTSIAPIFTLITRLTRLTTLELIETNLTIIDSSIEHLHRLNVLDLSENHLESLPSTINRLKSLKYFTVSNNPQLKSLQPLSGLQHLRLIQARDCSIRILPKNLPSLIDFYLSNNKIQTIRGIESLGSTSHYCKRFYLAGNHIKRVTLDNDDTQRIFILSFDTNVTLKYFSIEKHTKLSQVFRSHKTGIDEGLCPRN